MADVKSVTIRPARGPRDLEVAAVLITAYADSLGFDLSYQDFDTEMRSLPGKYAPPTGEILLAFDDTGAAIGCVAVRALMEDGCCEMKRLYITPAGRGAGAGKMLIEAILKTASDLEYREMRLDTLPSMTKAIQLYKGFGFHEIGPYYETPHPENMFLACRLPL